LCYHTKSMKSDMELFPKSPKQTSRAEDIVEKIKEGIVSGYWKPDEKINDQELSERFGVSRLTVREALSRLVERRLVEKRYWKGYTVRRLSLSEINGLIDVRLALEELALRQTFVRMSPSTIIELETSIESANAYLMSGDYHRFFNADYVFHEVLYRESGNPWLPDILQDLNVLISIVRVISQSEHVEHVAKESMSEHMQILEHLRSGHLDSAIDSLRIHLHNHRRRVRDEFDAWNTALLTDTDDT
jgi:DNA-binding GntR family transcriptional regulator